MAFSKTSTLLALLLSLSSLATAQTPGKSPEVHPKLTTWKCTKRNGCVKRNTAIVLDALAHPVHQLNDTSANCGDWGNAPPASVCPDAATCAKNCIMEGISNYTDYGIKTQGGNLYLKQLRDDGSSASPRVYLLAEGEKKYEMLKLTGNEFTFDVDVSKLPCGMNGALYLSEMAADGGKSKLNTGGAFYGTGYCDAQCYTTPFINGEANIAGKGACCNEMDIWEANAVATQLAPHTCNKTGLYQCTGDECGATGVCDKNGCGVNQYGRGNTGFYGYNKTVDTTRPFTVVTQFPAEKGVLKSIRRLYVQNGKVIQDASFDVSGLGVRNYLDDAYCSATGANTYMNLGGTKGMGGALSRGMVLAISIWWDAGGNMNWLDSGSAGPCNATEGSPENILKVQPDPAVVFSQIKWGEINSTFSAKH